MGSVAVMPKDDAVLIEQCLQEAKVKGEAMKKSSHKQTTDFVALTNNILKITLTIPISQNMSAQLYLEQTNIDQHKNLFYLNPLICYLNP